MWGMAGNEPRLASCFEGQIEGIEEGYRQAQRKGAGPGLVMCEWLIFGKSSQSVSEEEDSI
jgi:hypothetical protein